MEREKESSIQSCHKMADIQQKNYEVCKEMEKDTGNRKFLCSVRVTYVRFNKNQEGTKGTKGNHA